MDFIAEVERTFKMLDGAVLILSAKEGIQAQTKLLFNTLQKLQIPTIIFINKIDRDGVNLERLYLDIKTNLSQDVLFMQTVVDGLVYPICSQTYIKEEYKEFVCNHDDNICLGANRINRSIDNILHKQDILRQICFYIQIQTLQIHTGSVNLIDKYNCRDLQLL